MKVTDFKVSKSRAGKSQFRTNKSSDDKLLSNLSRVKKSVKLSTQSITLNKDNLNVTSRRLTLAELISKSRHNSPNVRNHALMSVIEFIRRYEAEGRLNLCIIIQIASSNLVHESSNIRNHARKLLVSIISTYLSHDGGYDNKHLESLYLHLIQGILSTNEQLRDDVYVVIGTILDGYPWVLSEYIDELLKRIVSNIPSYASFKHLNCLYALFKHRGDFSDEVTIKQIINYVINVISHASSVEGEADLKSGDIMDEELNCLTTTSMIVKSLKLLTLNRKWIKVNDPQVVDVLLNADLYEYENLTAKGKETFDALYSDFLFTRAELAIYLLHSFQSYHLPLMDPLIQLESMKSQVVEKCPQRVVEILFFAVSCESPVFNPGNLKLKPEWISQLISSTSQSDLKELKKLKRWLHANMICVKVKTNSFDQLDNCKPKQDEELDTSFPQVAGDSYRSIITSLFSAVINSPSALPLISLYKGLTPQLFVEIFSFASTHWEYLKNIPMDIEPLMDLEINFNEVIESFLQEKNQTMTTVCLKLLLYISRDHLKLQGIDVIRYLKEFNHTLIEEHHLIICRIFLNLKLSMDVVGAIEEIISHRLSGNNKLICEYFNVLLHHVFGLESGRGIGDSRMDERGRLIVRSDSMCNCVKRVDYMLDMVHKLMKEMDPTSIKLLTKMIIDRFLYTLNHQLDDLESAVKILLEQSITPFIMKLTKSESKIFEDVIKIYTIVEDQTHS